MWLGIPQIGTESPFTPIQAELIKRLELNKLSVGDSVLARVQLGWKSPSCELRRGDILLGRIIFRKTLFEKREDLRSRNPL